jgi:hypothetical protein
MVFEIELLNASYSNVRPRVSEILRVILEIHVPTKSVTILK